MGTRFGREVDQSVTYGATGPDGCGDEHLRSPFVRAISTHRFGDRTSCDTRGPPAG